MDKFNLVVRAARELARAVQENWRVPYKRIGACRTRELL